MIVFDLDDTLVMTRQAVIEAYRMAGVEMPDDAWGKPWYEWLDCEFANQKHEIKNLAYRTTLVTHAKPSQLLTYALRENAPVITGASAEAVMLIKEQFAPKLNVLLVAASLDLKVQWLNFRSELGTYVDDDPNAREYIRQRTAWQTLDPETCLQSFLRQDRTFGSKERCLPS